MSPVIGRTILLAAATVWAMSLGRYAIHALRSPGIVSTEFRDDTAGPSAALPGIATLLMALALMPYWRAGGVAFALAGLCWQVPLALGHGASNWQNGRVLRATVPNIYLPTVAGNLTAGAVLGALGWTDWGWLFFGAGVFSWLALESIMMQALWSPNHLPLESRALIGIQFAPPAVATMALMLLQPDGAARVLIALWGYALFQILIGLRLVPWLVRQPFALSYWSYTFGIGSFTITTLKLASLGFGPARALAPIAFGIANALILCLAMAAGARGLGWRRADRVGTSPAPQPPVASNSRFSPVFLQARETGR